MLNILEISGIVSILNSMYQEDQNIRFTCIHDSRASAINLTINHTGWLEVYNSIKQPYQTGKEVIQHITLAIDEIIERLRKFNNDEDLKEFKSFTDGNTVHHKEEAFKNYQKARKEHLESIPKPEEKVYCKKDLKDGDEIIYRSAVSDRKVVVCHGLGKFMNDYGGRRMSEYSDKLYVKGKGGRNKYDVVKVIRNGKTVFTR